MVRLLTFLLGVIVTLQLAICPYALAAADVTYTTNGGIQAKAPVNKIGALLLADGLAIMNGAAIEIVAKGPDGTQQSQLNGKIFKAEQIGTGGNAVVSGFAFFTGGPGLSALDRGSCTEHVDLNDGTKVPGPIDDITPDQVIAGGKTIPMGDVRLVHSKRVYQFRAVGDKVSRMNFEATCTKAAPIDKQKVGKSKAFKITVILLVVAAIAVAIAVPVAIAAGGGGGGHRNPPPSGPTGGGSSGGGGSGGGGSGSGGGTTVNLNGNPFIHPPFPPRPPNNG